MPDKDFLSLHLRDLPYFRALIRAVEASFYQALNLPAPTLDVGCGDGHFASLTFERKIEVGLDPWHGPIHEARRRGCYRLLVGAEGGVMPFPDGYFASAFSNSVLEHIPHVEQVLAEIARVLKPGAPFYFCVPNPNFTAYLSVARFLARLKLNKLSQNYCTFFNRISRHYHCDGTESWEKHLTSLGFTVEDWWHYYPPPALAVLEWGHYLGLPSLITKKIFGRWIIAPFRWNIFFLYHLLKKHVKDPRSAMGAYTFYIATLHKTPVIASPMDECTG